MELHEQINTINTKKDLAQFIQNLRLDLMTNIGDWENPNLERFLNAMSAWISSMDNIYKNTGGEIFQCNLIGICLLIFYLRQKCMNNLH